jgi:hypothetical protein
VNATLEKQMHAEVCMFILHVDVLALVVHSLEETFGHMDDDSSGNITQREFEDGLKVIGPLKHITSAEIGLLFAKFDQDGNGRISQKVHGGCVAAWL